jgi:hypothetical protein
VQVVSVVVGEVAAGAVPDFGQDSGGGFLQDQVAAGQV